MGVLLLFGSSMAHQLESMLVKNYKHKYGDGGLLFNALMSLFALIYFVVSDKDGFFFPQGIWGYGIMGAALYAIGFYSVYIAMGCGSYALTNLLMSFTSVFTIGFGLIYLKEPATGITYFAIVLSFLSILLMNYKKDENASGNLVTPKWLLCMLLGITSNGILTILSRLQQIHFENQCTNEYLIISLSGSFIALLVAGITKDRKNLANISKYGVFTGAVAGILNGVGNYIRIQSYLYIPIMLAAPIESGMKIVLTFVIAFLIYKEKLTKTQMLGAGLSGVALILLNIK
ncbi:MAG: DMT family transporter [Lachnospiraceae bacterium]|nr:DMT family transporter [Lachnospiraceae bacterium]